jgi:hypothetical protein
MQSRLKDRQPTALYCFLAIRMYFLFLGNSPGAFHRHTNPFSVANTAPAKAFQLGRIFA